MHKNMSFTLKYIMYDITQTNLSFVKIIFHCDYYNKL